VYLVKDPRTDKEEWAEVSAVEKSVDKRFVAQKDLLTGTEVRILTAALHTCGR
jgi:hypothetical protein